MCSESQMRLCEEVFGLLTAPNLISSLCLYYTIQNAILSRGAEWAEIAGLPFIGARTWIRTRDPYNACPVTNFIVDAAGIEPATFRM